MSGKLYDLLPEQARAADPGHSVWLSASAGTGKTQVLSARVLRLLLQLWLRAHLELLPVLCEENDRVLLPPTPSDRLWKHELTWLRWHAHEAHEVRDHGIVKRPFLHDEFDNNVCVLRRPADHPQRPIFLS